MSLGQATDTYLEGLALAGRAKTTIISYGYILRAMGRHLGQKRKVHSVTESEIASYLRSIREEHSKGYALLVGRIVKGLCAWLTEREEFKRNPVGGLRLGAPPVEPVCPFSKEEIRRLIRASETPFERAVVLLLLDTGMRASELCGLNAATIDFEGGLLTVHGKGDKTRDVTLNDVPRQALEAYMQQASLHDGRIWPEKFKRQALARMLDKIGQRAGVSHVHAHRFRHTFSCYFYLETNDALALQQICGWSSLAMVSRYTAWVQSQRALTVHRQHSPTASL